MKDLWRFMKLSLNPDDLPTMKDVLDRLQDNDANTAIEKLRDEQMNRYHNTLLWRYPLSQGTAAGGFILPVREGILWIPYGETGTYEGDLMITDDSHILSESDCYTMLRDFSSYASQLCDVLQQSATISHRLENREGGTMIDLGSFEVVSGKLAISDPCYDVDVWCRGDLENCKLGSWLASALEKHMGAWGHRICKLIAVHEDYQDQELGISEHAPFEVGVDSGQAGIFDAAHYQDASVVPKVGHKHLFEGAEADPWYDYCCDITLSSQSAGILPFGCVSSSGFGDGGYDCYFWRNSEGQIVRVEIEYIVEDDDDEDDIDEDDIAVEDEE